MVTYRVRIRIGWMTYRERADTLFSLQGRGRISHTANTQIGINTDATGQYFDMKNAAKAIPQAYDERARAKLREVTEEMLEKFSPVMVY